MVCGRMREEFFAGWREVNTHNMHGACVHPSGSSSFFRLKVVKAGEVLCCVTFHGTDSTGKGFKLMQSVCGTRETKRIIFLPNGGGQGAHCAFSTPATCMERACIHREVQVFSSCHMATTGMSFLKCPRNGTSAPNNLAWSVTPHIDTHTHTHTHTTHACNAMAHMHSANTYA